MDELTKTRIRWTGLGAAVGIGLGTLLGFGIWGGPGDEDRPPIFVKNGSLIFQSFGSKGKPWHPRGSSDTEWYSNHANGKAVTQFRVYFLGGQLLGQPCPSHETHEVSIYFDADGDGVAGESKYSVVLRQENNNKKVPVVEGPDLKLHPSDRTIIQTGTPNQGWITRVVSSEGECKRDGPDHPLEVAIESVR